jgi:hypothetical protein
MWQPSSERGQANRSRAYHQYLDKGHPQDYRRKEIKALARAIRARENRLVLGVPGMGVSNLLRFLVTREGLFERPVNFVYLDCGGLSGSRNFKTFYEEIARQLREQGLGSQLEERVGGYDQLKRILERVGGDPLSRVVIVVDQTDSIVKAADEDFYRKLKTLTNLNKRVCYIFAASPSVAGRVDPDHLLFAGRRLIVGQLNEQDCTGAIEEEARRLGTEFDPAMRDRLARLTGGHPGLLRAVSSAADEEGLDTSNAEATWVEQLSAREDVQYRCLKIWKEFDPAQQAALRPLARGQSDAVGVDSLTWFQDLGLVDEHQGSYRLFSPLFQRIIAAQEIESKPIIPRTTPESDTQGTLPESVRIEGPTIISWNEQEITIAGKVFKGNQEVRVSPMELRFIACLKQPERKVFSKEDIARYVYYDESEEGKRIPDSRVEDLVRRVRKRLGKQYIRTHWGQGYELLG